MRLDEATAAMQRRVEEVVTSLRDAGIDVTEPVLGDPANCRDGANERTANFSQDLRIDVNYGDDGREPALRAAFAKGLGPVGADVDTSSTDRSTARVTDGDLRFALMFGGPGAATLFVSTGCHPTA